MVTGVDVGWFTLVSVGFNSTFQITINVPTEMSLKHFLDRELHIPEPFKRDYFSFSIYTLNERPIN